MCKFCKIYETDTKVGVNCTHPVRVGYGQPKRITCELVCNVCDLDKELVVDDQENTEQTNTDGETDAVDEGQMTPEVAETAFEA